MTWLDQLLPPALVRALGWTLIHSLWQGAVVALALAGLLLVLRRHAAQVRYRTAAAALLTLLLLCGFTFGRYYYQAPPAMVAAAALSQADEAGTTPPTAAATALAASPAVGLAAPGWLASWQAYFDANLPLLVTVWLMGLLVMLLRLLGSLAYVQRLRRYRVQPLAAEWQQRLAALADRAGLKQRIELLESALVKVPVVVGHLRPVVLLPLGTVTGLGTAYLEAVLAHELAHVQRRDYLLNLLQAVAETVLFYHPGVWFMAACLRTERENCCDDVATALIGGNPLTVARALAALAELTAAPAPAGAGLALSALGPDGSVLGRIRRLVQGRQRPTFAEGFMAACVVLVGLVVLSTAVALARPAATSLATALAKPAAALRRATTPAPLQSGAALAAAPAAVPGAATAPREALRILSVSAAGQARARLGNTEVSFDTTRNPRLMRWSRAGRRAGPDEGTVIIKRDKKGRLTELLVDGQPVDIAPARKKGDQVDIVQLNSRPNQATGAAPGSSQQRMEELASRLNRAALSGSSPSAADAQELSALALAEGQKALSETNVDAITRDALSRVDFEGITRDAFAQAEKELQAAAKRARTDEEREAIENQLEELRDRQQDRLQELRERQQDRQDDAQDRRDREQHRRDLDQQMRDRQQAFRDADQARRDVDQAKRDAEQAKRDEATNALLRELRKDNIIQNTNNLQFSLSASALTVNGKKQPAAVQQKYLRLVEQLQGRPLRGNYNLNYQTSGSTTSTVTGSANGRRTPPAPPAPRAAPTAVPAAPPAPPQALPAPPPPPPVLTTDEIRAELRRDGLIGASDKGFQFQLNNKTMTVNGQQQPAAVADRYRRLLGVEPGTAGKSSRNIQISVSE
ncbi:M56 family metallopeptidase [Hymenobacter actinosclerus]|uniref:Signal transducer regulating beta-lactamase production, contains metallopeptidase domain n=1 Tax=Hymenobacter actinosclerus TaxID=82805 RepID=A0A1I0ALY5_9BACT|nr:M56 family metallopeptidase [Hymenobacter actinosclerus]SES95304.1 Signal transducer regulating beta-lactamase production, contains metallopeptidase domain [Hymenobacter actinosclerus]